MFGCEENEREKENVPEVSGTSMLLKHFNSRKDNEGVVGNHIELNVYG